MGKNIVILIGSPRPKGSSAALARAFAEGARSAGHNVTEFFLGGMDIQGCKACRGGRSDRDFPCVQHDGMDAPSAVQSLCRTGNRAAAS